MGLLKTAMEKDGRGRYLIDGFPRAISNREAFLKVMGFDAKFVLFLKATNEVL